MASWRTELFKDVLNPFRLAYKGRKDENPSNFMTKIGTALEGGRLHEWPEYMMGKKEIRSDEDLWSGVQRTLSSGLGKEVDEPVHKYAGPGITGYFGGPLGAAAGAGLGEKMYGGSYEDALKSAGIAAVASYLGGKLFKGNSPSASASGEAGVGASTTGSVPSSASGSVSGYSDISGLAAAEAANAPSTLHGGEVSGLAVQDGAPAASQGDSGSWYSNLWDNVKGEFEKNPEMFYKLLGAMGDNLMSGRPAMQGVAQPMATSAIANRAQQRQDLERRELLKAFAEYLSNAKKSGLGSLEEGYNITPKGQRGIDSVRREVGEDGTITEIITEVLFDPNEEVSF